MAFKRGGWGVGKAPVFSFFFFFCFANAVVVHRINDVPECGVASGYSHYSQYESKTAGTYLRITPLPPPSLANVFEKGVSVGFSECCYSFPSHTYKDPSIFAHICSPPTL